MISDKLKELIRPPILVQRLLWFVIVGSIIFYICFVYIFVGGNIILTASFSSNIEVVVYVLAGLAGVGSIYYYQRALSTDKLREFMDKDMDLESFAKDPRTKGIDEAKLKALNSLSAQDQKIYSLMFEYQKIIIITLILNEIIVILGSVLSFINDDVSRIVPFGIVSLVLCFWMFPRPYSLIDRVHKL